MSSLVFAELILFFIEDQIRIIQTFFLWSLLVSRSYSQSPDSSISTHSDSTATKSTSDTTSETKKSKVTEAPSYDDDDFEEATDRKR